MRGLVLGGFLLTAAASCQPAAHDPLVGVWSITDVSFTTPDMSRTITNPQPGIFIFTEHHYSFFHIWGEEPRDSLPDDPSDAERLASLERLRASLGTYEVSDSTLTTTRLIASVENLTGESHTSRYRIRGDTLWVVWETDDGEAIYRFSRLE